MFNRFVTIDCFIFVDMYYEQARTGTRQNCTFPCLSHDNLTYEIIMEQTNKFPKPLYGLEKIKNIFC